MSNNKLNKDGVKAFWDRVFVLIKKITGDVDVKNKGTLQEQVNGVSIRVEECFTSVSNGKKAVANAITGKGISTAEDAEFATMAENIGKIKSTPKLQSKSAELNTGTTSVTMKPDTGYDGLSQATASIVLQEKAATLKTSAQNITPDSDKLLSKVSVPAVPGNAALTHVLAGKTFSSATAGVDKTGKMANKAGTTVKASAVSQDDNNTYLTIPAAGYYDTTSKVYTENSNLSKQISFKKLHSSAQDSGITNVSVSGYSQYLLVMCYGSNNDNPLDWGCSTSRGTTVQLGQQRSSRTSVAGACSAYIINVGDKNSVNISCRYHNNGATMIFGIE